MTSISKNMYVDKLADIVNKYNNTYHSTIKMKPVDVKSSTYIDFNKENNKEDLKFEIGDHVRILQYKHHFAKKYVADWSEKVFVIKKVKNTVRQTYVIENFNGEEIVGTFCEKKFQKNKSSRVYS